jgi:hypothetical protein
MKKLTIAAALVAVAVAVPLSIGSSHREAPNIMLDPTADNTDVYAFTAKNSPGTLTVAANWIPGQVAANGPNFFRFDDRAVYYINIDSTGDGKPEVRYRYTFRTKIRDRNTYRQAKPEVTSLGDPDLVQAQTYDVVEERYRNGRLRSSTRIARSLPVVPSNAGPNTMPNYRRLSRQGVKGLPGGGKVFAGQRDEPFFIDLGATFDNINLRVPPGNAGGGKDDFSGQNTNSIVMQLPEREVTRNGKQVSSARAKNAVVGVWASTDRRRLEVTNADFDRGAAPSSGGGAQGASGGGGSGSGSQSAICQQNAGGDARCDIDQSGNTQGRGRQPGSAAAPSAGGFVQVSRLANPLVNELFPPVVMKDLYNRTTPAGDGQRFGRFVMNPEVARILNEEFPIVRAPERRRNDLVQALLQGLPGLNRQVSGPNPPAVDTLKINLGIPPALVANRFGVLAGDKAGFPNGRRLEDDIVDIDVRLIAGFLKNNKQPLGDGVVRNDKPFLSEFPYLAEPTSGFDSNPSDRIEPPQPPDPPDPNPADGL